TVMGTTSTASDGSAPDSSSARSYCIPGDTTTCDPPVGHWQLDENTGTSAYDSSGNSNTGNLGTGTSSPEWAIGKFGSGLDFDGTDDYVDMGADYATEFDGPFTLSAWVNTPVNPAQDQQVVVGKGRFTYYYLEIDTDDDRANFDFDSGGSSAGFVQSPIESAPDNTWVYITGVYDGQYNSIYINGVLTNSVETTGDPDSGSGYNLNIGRDSRGPDGYFEGKIDDVRIYDYARTPAQVAWDYNRGAPIGWWKFNECESTTAYDSSLDGNGDSNGNHGTIHIGATAPNTSAGTCASGNSTHAWYNGNSGKRGASLDFDGVDDYVYTVDDPALEFSNAITISAWIYPETVTGEYIILYYSNEYAVEILNGNLRLAIQGASFTWGNSGIPIPENEWTHLTVNHDGNSTWTTYLNGIYRGTYSQTEGTQDDTDPLCIGDAYGGTTHPFNGKIDDVRIYNYLLTRQQIQNNMNEGAVGFR
ncbi:LamG domain-containing protein, partial [Patescibacteria group bacterium]|nr:LamG domain-containing protein [Patescibacteria group bacterium]